MNSEEHKIPVLILTGFLGSGKTTFLKKMIASPLLADTAVLINEFGEVGLDHLLVNAIDEEVILLDSGCVCCSVKDDFSQTLLDLISKKEQNKIPAFSRVVLETTGIADPLSIYHLLVNDNDLKQYFTYMKIITIVDGVYGLTNLDQHAEAIHQVVLADEIVLAKADLAVAQDLRELGERMHALNSTASISQIGLEDSPDFDLMLNEAQTDPGKNTSSKEIAISVRDSPKNGVQHAGRYSSYCLKWSDPVNWDDFEAWLDRLLFVRGNSILRLKGLLCIEGESRPVVIQGVQHSFYPPGHLPEWPNQEPMTELTFITSDFSERAAKNSVKDVFKIESI